MDTIIRIAGVLIVILSFLFIMKNPKQSLMDTLMAKRRTTEQEKDEPDQE
ncbi:hypothetical protein [Emergencia sp.]